MLPQHCSCLLGAAEGKVRTLQPTPHPKAARSQTSMSLGSYAPRNTSIRADIARPMKHTTNSRASLLIAPTKLRTPFWTDRYNDSDNARITRPNSIGPCNQARDSKTETRAVPPKRMETPRTDPRLKKPRRNAASNENAVRNLFRVVWLMGGFQGIFAIANGYRKARRTGTELFEKTSVTIARLPPHSPAIRVGPRMRASSRSVTEFETDGIMTVAANPVRLPTRNSAIVAKTAVKRAFKGGSHGDFQSPICGRM